MSGGFWYTPTAGYPVYGSQSSSLLQQNEENLVKLGFDKLATPTGYANHIVKVSNAETGYDFSAATLTAAGVMAGLTGLSSSGTINFTTGTVTAATPGSNINTTQIPTTAWVNSWYAPLASPPLTGVPTAPTAAPGTNTTQLATTAYADAISALKANLAGGNTITGTQNLTGAVVNVATQASSDSSTLAASTAMVQSVAALKANLAGGNTITGTQNLTGAVVNVATQASSDSSTLAASTAFVQAVAFNSALPAQTGNAGKFVTTDGANASWATMLPTEPLLFFAQGVI